MSERNESGSEYTVSTDESDFVVSFFLGSLRNARSSSAMNFAGLEDEEVVVVVGSVFVSSVS